MKHTAPSDFIFDLTDGQTQVEVAEAAELLYAAARAAMLGDDVSRIGQGVGQGGRVDLFLALLDALAGPRDEDAAAYTRELFAIAANKIIDTNPDIAHSL